MARSSPFHTSFHRTSRACNQCSSWGASSYEFFASWRHARLRTSLVPVQERDGVCDDLHERCPTCYVPQLRNTWIQDTKLCGIGRLRKRMEWHQDAVTVAVVRRLHQTTRTGCYERQDEGEAGKFSSKCDCKEKSKPESRSRNVECLERAARMKFVSDGGPTWWECVRSCLVALVRLRVCLGAVVIPCLL